jgi:hypothetical protein
VTAGSPSSFPPDRETEVHVRFEHVDGGTRVVVEHLGWDGIRRSTPPATVSRCSRSSNAWPSSGRRCATRWQPRQPHEQVTRMNLDVQAIGRGPGFDVHVAALRDAGFREVDTIWQALANRWC